MTLLLPLVFFGVAFLYAMAGFGGGSSYIAFLAISGLPVGAIPVLALICNLIVAGQGSLILAKGGHLKSRFLVPLLACSIPAAFIGGAWRIDSQAYLWILTVVLTLSGVTLLNPTPPHSGDSVPRSRPFYCVLGTILGALAGLSGIGGGIFLAPILHLLKAGKAREIAGASALFIALNSAAGLLGQLSKDLDRLTGIPTFLFIACPLAVLVGGTIGSYNLSLKLPPSAIRRVTACVVLIAAVRLWLRLVLQY